MFGFRHLQKEVLKFIEDPQGRDTSINAGIFVFEREGSLYYNTICKQAISIETVSLNYK